MTNNFDDEKGRLQRALDELVALNKIAGAVNALMTVRDITRVIIDNCLQRTGAAQGTVFLIDESDQTFEKAKTFVREFSRDSGQIPFHLSASLTAWMKENRTILISNNPDSDDRLKRLGLSSLGVDSILSAPLLSQSGLIGWLVLFNKKDPGGFTDNDKRFIGIVVSQTTKVIENARLREREEQLTIIQEEIKVARQIQEKFLPQTGIALKNCKICGHNYPAKDVGGDFFDIVSLEKDRAFISLGDVTGKGIPAALLMANAQAVLRSQLTRTGKLHLERLAGSLNNLIYEFTTADRFITGILACYDDHSGSFRYINAGHPAPILIRNDGTMELPSSADIVIGVVPDYAFTEFELTLHDGDIVCIYSDGISELFNDADEQFGEERLCALLREYHRLDVPEICARINAALTSFRGDRLQSDDITFVIVKVAS